MGQALGHCGLKSGLGSPLAICLLNKGSQVVPYQLVDSGAGIERRLTSAGQDVFFDGEREVLHRISVSHILCKAPQRYVLSSTLLISISSGKMPSVRMAKVNTLVPGSI